MFIDYCAVDVLETRINRSVMLSVFIIQPLKTLLFQTKFLTLLLILLLIEDI